MEKYLVGGAVRDKLLKLPVQEKDWVVVGSSPQEMLDIGYEQVGKDFPVFLHPESHEEYALARTERKSGQGYTGFICHTAPSITIEEDLYRRDLTINAMAYDSHGNLVDPYHGQRDIELRLLRHVSHTFHEDPLRVLRVARFAARFAHLNFTIAPETLILMKQMIHELLSLSPERVWTETKKALITDNPQVYFTILRHCGALKILFPELDALFNIPDSTQYCTKINTGCYTMRTLSKAAHLTDDISVRFSVLCRDLGKGILLNKKNKNIKHHNHRKLGITLIHDLCNRFKIPHEIRNFSKIISEYHGYLYNVKILAPEMLMTLFRVFDCWRRPNRIDQIILISQSEAIRCENYNNYSINQENLLRTAFIVTKKISTANIIKDGFTGSNISKELYARRLHALNSWKNKQI
ncbi:tRNA CCA-pyrophosphorylase [Blochmannia endosymbiont of Camponotus sp.]|uniref:tRNA CCA-pyrophosphorylase n=1 Tax=Blochmannia endosymbiont of Camponotus sp. TaxID=700220 RepID=UPI0020244B36|nr:tRNA CCA-pyrophosphorylase [Blochmannia endosymbiont of Camponotus sp.]URJ25817.1 tRNA CCA-pyrophosphorylase [Blochmannia endosymbiont of Camponotus sp.]